ncbi:hypothetical protein HDV05_001652 [Chytridiales sp. JEL 0842]|nr:hypothetical protein HDV05_001652 [Chytridiales sp. JEL 0842]
MVGAVNADQMHKNALNVDLSQPASDTALNSENASNDHPLESVPTVGLVDSLPHRHHDFTAANNQDIALDLSNATDTKETASAALEDSLATTPSIPADDDANHPPDASTQTPDFASTATFQSDLDQKTSSALIGNDLAPTDVSVESISTKSSEDLETTNVVVSPDMQKNSPSKAPTGHEERNETLVTGERPNKTTPIAAPEQIPTLTSSLMDLSASGRSLSTGSNSSSILLNNNTTSFPSTSSSKDLIVIRAPEEMSSFVSTLKMLQNNKIASVLFDRTDVLNARDAVFIEKPNISSSKSTPNPFSLIESHLTTISLLTPLHLLQPTCPQASNANIHRIQTSTAHLSTLLNAFPNPTFFKSLPTSTETTQLYQTSVSNLKECLQSFLQAASDLEDSNNFKDLENVQRVWSGVKEGVESLVEALRGVVEVCERMVVEAGVSEGRVSFEESASSVVDADSSATASVLQIGPTAATLRKKSIASRLKERFSLTASPSLPPPTSSTPQTALSLSSTYPRRSFSSNSSRSSSEDSIPEPSKLTPPTMQKSQSQGPAYKPQNKLLLQTTTTDPLFNVNHGSGSPGLRSRNSTGDLNVLRASHHQRALGKGAEEGGRRSLETPSSSSSLFEKESGKKASRPDRWSKMLADVVQFQQRTSSPSPPRSGKKPKSRSPIRNLPTWSTPPASTPSSPPPNKLRQALTNPPSSTHLQPPLTSPLLLSRSPRSASQTSTLSASSSISTLSLSSQSSFSIEVFESLRRLSVLEEPMPNLASEGGQQFESLGILKCGKSGGRLGTFDSQGRRIGTLDQGRFSSDVTDSDEADEEGGCIIVKGNLLHLTEGGNSVLVMEMMSSRLQIRFGTLEKLLLRLADESIQDMDYVDTLVQMHSFFTNPLDLLENLILRYRISPPPNPTPADLEYFAKWKRPIQLKVLTVIGRWVKLGFEVLMYHPTLRRRVDEFLEEVWEDGFKGEAERIRRTAVVQACAISLRDRGSPLELELVYLNADEEDVDEDTVESSLSSRPQEMVQGGVEMRRSNSSNRGQKPPTTPAIPNTRAQQPPTITTTATKRFTYNFPPLISAPSNAGFGDSTPLLWVDTRDLARYLTVADWSAFVSISVLDYLTKLTGSGLEHLNASSEKEPKVIRGRVDLFAQRSNTLRNWVALEICCTRNLKARRRLIEKFIAVAKYCKDHSNFHTSLFIVSGLLSPAVQRLKKTWEGVGGRETSVLKALERLLDPSGNMKAYRKVFAGAKPPVVPFFPVVMKDLTFWNDGNPGVKAQEGENEVVNTGGSVYADRKSLLVSPQHHPSNTMTRTVSGLSSTSSLGPVDPRALSISIPPAAESTSSGGLTVLTQAALVKSPTATFVMKSPVTGLGLSQVGSIGDSSSSSSSNNLTINTNPPMEASSSSSANGSIPSRNSVLPSSPARNNLALEKQDTVLINFDKYRNMMRLVGRYINGATESRYEFTHQILPVLRGVSSRLRTGEEYVTMGDLLSGDIPPIEAIASLVEGRLRSIAGDESVMTMAWEMAGKVEEGLQE